MTASTKQPPAPLTEDELMQLQQLLDELPEPLEPLDVTMLDGFLCGVLLQPRRVPEAEWFAHAVDVDGGKLPEGRDLEPLRRLTKRRHAELDHAIAQRDWFDPWIYEFEEDTPPSETVMPWVAGFATALALFPGLMQIDSDELMEPLATLYAHLNPEDLEDADELLAEIETLEPPQDLAEAVEGLVRSTLLLADISRPRQAAPAKRPAANKRRKPARKR
jgi:uncharacterized protein